MLETWNYLDSSYLARWRLMVRRATRCLKSSNTLLSPLSVIFGQLERVLAAIYDSSQLPRSVKTECLEGEKVLKAFCYAHETSISNFFTAKKVKKIWGMQNLRLWLQSKLNSKTVESCEVLETFPYPSQFFVGKIFTPKKTQNLCYLRV